MPRPDVFESLDRLAGPEGEAARDEYEAAPRAYETPDITDARVAGAAQQRRLFGRVKAEDLSSRGIAYSVTPRGDTKEVTDSTGAPLTNADRTNKVAYDSSGRPVDYSQRDSSGQPVLRDPYESAPEVTDKTGAKYRTPRGLPWQPSGTDEAAASQYQARQTQKLNSATYTALGGEETDLHREASAAAKAAKASGKDTYSMLAGQMPEEQFDMNADGPTLRAQIDNAFNREYGSRKANEKPWFGGGKLSPSAEAYRRDIDQRKSAALEQLDNHLTVRQQAQDAAAKLQTIQQQRSGLRTDKLAEINEERRAAGLEAVGLPEAPQKQSEPERSFPIQRSIPEPQVEPSAPDGQPPQVPGQGQSSSDQPATPAPVSQSEGAIATAGRELASKFFPALGTAGGAVLGAGAGGLAGSPSGPGAVATAIGGAMLGGSAGGTLVDKLQHMVMGREWTEENERQMEANRAAHPIAAQLGSMVPFLMSLAGGNKGLTQLAPMIGKLGTRIATAAAGGARAGLSEGSQQRFVEGKDVNPLDVMMKDALAFGATALFPPAKSLLMAATGRAVTDAAAMTLANTAYDAAVHGKPFDLEAVSQQMGGDIPAFMIQNAILGLLHRMPLTTPKGGTPPAAGQPGTPPAQPVPTVGQPVEPQVPPTDLPPTGAPEGQPAPPQPETPSPSNEIPEPVPTEGEPRPAPVAPSEPEAATSNTTGEVQQEPSTEKGQTSAPEPSRTGSEARTDTQNQETASSVKPAPETPSAQEQRRIAGPALVDANGDVIARGKVGETHADLIAKAAKNGVDATDAERVFLDDRGDVLTREQAGPIAEAAGQRREGTSGPLQSEHLQANETKSTDVAAKESKPETSFTTAKGSKYTVHEDGTTTRDKAARPEHPGDSGPMPRSHATFYVDEAGANALSEVQAQGGPKATLRQLKDGRWGVYYLEGKDAGKMGARTVTKVSDNPAVGLYPVEIWKDSSQPHFGNKITNIETKGGSKSSEASKPSPETENVTKLATAALKLRRKELKALDHPEAFDQGQTTSGSGIEINSETGRITMDAEKFARNSDNAAREAVKNNPKLTMQAARLEHAKAIIGEEVEHLKTVAFEKSNPTMNAPRIKALVTTEPKIAEGLAKSYKGWDKLNDWQKGHEIFRAILQTRNNPESPRPITESTYRLIGDFVKWLKEHVANLGGDTAKLVKELETMLKERIESTKEEVPAPEAAKEQADRDQRPLLAAEAEEKREVVTKPAVRDKNGTVRTGQIHALIEGAGESGSTDGFVTDDGRFVTREQADKMDRKVMPMRVRGDVSASEIQDPIRREAYLEKELEIASAREKEQLESQLKSTREEISRMGYEKRGNTYERVGTPEEQRALQTRTETAKQDILADIKSGAIPEDVKSWEQLAEHVDPNEYVNDADRSDRLIGPLGKKLGWGVQDYADFTSNIIGNVDRWLKSGRTERLGAAETEEPKRLREVVDAARASELVDSFDRNDPETWPADLGKGVEKPDGNDVATFKWALSPEEQAAIDAHTSGRKVMPLPEINRLEKKAQAAFDRRQNQARVRANDLERQMKESRFLYGAETEKETGPFYSQLTRAVEQLPQETMTVAQARAAISKGAKPDEIKMAGILDDPLSPMANKQPGDKVTKAELKDYAVERQTQVKDVTLGNPGRDEIGGELHKVWPGLTDGEIESALSGPFTDKVRQKYEALADESKKAVDKWFEENQSAIDAREPSTSGPGGVHFETYQLPGADPGSYREQFVTWPVETEDARAKLGDDLLAKVKSGEMTTKEAYAHLDATRGKAPSWKDGHSQYDSINNPVVRIRRNIRTDADGKKTFFIEEMQGPGKAEQEKMPPEVRKRIYEIGMKRAIRDAIDSGADAIGWTDGQTQADRYSLEKKVRTIEWTGQRDGIKNVTITPIEGNDIEFKVTPDGKTASFSGGSNDAFAGKTLDEVIGKDAAEKIMGERDGSLSGDGLKVGGEGLKRLYDVTLPRIADKLAEKMGAKTGTTDIAVDEGQSWQVSDNTGDPMYRTESREDAMRFAEKHGYSDVKRIGEPKNSPVHSLTLPDQWKKDAPSFPLYGAKTPEPDADIPPNERDATGHPLPAAPAQPATTLPGKIESVLNRVLKGGRFFWEGAADTLKRAGYNTLADATKTQADVEGREWGKTWKPFREVLDEHPASQVEKLKGQDSPENTKAKAEFEQYFRDRENGREAKADADLKTFSDGGKDLIDAWKKAAVDTGATLKKLDVEVQDGDKWRPIGNLGEKFFPRKINQTTQEVLQNPEKHPAEWDRLVQDLIDNGNIKTADEATKFLKDTVWRDNSKNDYYANIEQARKAKLPESWLDYSFNEIAPWYATHFARRVGQIEAYGQEHKGGDLFDKTLETIPKRRDYLPTQEYVQAAKDAAYFRNDNTGLANSLRNLQTFATGAYLANPMSAIRNVVSGVAQTGIQHGPSATLKASWDTLMHLKERVADAKDMGILRDDLMQMMMETRDIHERKAERALRTVTGAGLKYTGFNLAEDFARATSMTAAKNFARHAADEINADPTSAASKEAKAFLIRHDMDPAAIASENGDGPATDKFVRASVREGQFGYKFDQTPLYHSNPIVKFITQFQKWGTQMARFLAKHVINPAVHGTEVDGETVRTIKPLLYAAAAAIGGGELLYYIRDLLTDRERPDASMGETSNALDQNTKEGISQIGSRLFSDVINSGGLGVFGDYAGNLREFATRGRAKNPFNPPGVQAFGNIFNAIATLKQQGKLTGDDVWDIVKQQFPGAKFAEDVKNKVTGNELNQALGIQASARRAGMRMAQEMGLPVQQPFSAALPTKTEKTPLYRDISEALLTGDAAAAAKTWAEHLKSLPVGESDKAKEALKASINAHVPIKVGGLASAENTQKFAQWASRRMPPEEFAQIMALNARYWGTAARAGLVKGAPVAKPPAVASSTASKPARSPFQFQ